jgi:2-oxoglutarate dehydrogenase complex dehydrogenase (E1) component-like enzyme
MVNFNEYNVGSTIHIIINNQIGFATALAKNRYVMYVSDLANYNAQIFQY